MNDKKNIWFFVESYGDMPNINGICVKNVADSLVKMGHNVSVFTCFTELGQKKRSIIDGVRVYRIHRALSSDLMNIIKKHPNKMLKIFTAILMKCNAFFFYILLNKWPLHSFMTVPRYIHNAKRELSNGNIPDIVVGTYFHIEEVLSAVRIKKYSPHCKTVLYLLDAMGGRENPIFLKNSIYPVDTRRAVEKWERKIFKKVDYCLVMNAHREYFAKNYPNFLNKKVLFTDIPLLRIDNIPEVKKTAINPHVYKFVYTGFSSPETGAATYFLKLLEKLENVEFHMYGRTDESVQNAIQNSSIYNKKLFYHGYVDNKKCKEVQGDADCLVTFGSVNRCMISGKIFEYMSTSKPILCFYQIDDDINIEYISKYSPSLVIKEEIDKISNNVEKVRAFISEEPLTLSKKELTKVFYYNTPSATAHLLLELQ